MKDRCVGGIWEELNLDGGGFRGVLPSMEGLRVISTVEVGGEFGRDETETWVEPTLPERSLPDGIPMGLLSVAEVTVDVASGCDYIGKSW